MKDALKQSFETEPAGAPMKCLWMLAGVVGYKLCDREYDCEHCPFDRSLHEGAHSQSGARRAFTDNTPAGEIRIREAGVTNLEGYDVAGALFYHPAHVWARIEDKGRVRIGLDDFGQKLAGRIYCVRLPAPGTSINRNQACWRITHKAGESELAAPVSGIVARLNAKLVEQPSLINRDPYGEGWVMIVEPVGLEECLKQLLYGQKARAWCELDINLLYQKLNRLLTDAPPEVGATMQDGGALMRDFTHILAADQIRQLIDSFLTVPACVPDDGPASKEREVIL